VSNTIVRLSMVAPISIWYFCRLVFKSLLNGQSRQVRFTARTIPCHVIQYMKKIKVCLNFRQCSVTIGCAEPIAGPLEAYAAGFALDFALPATLDVLSGYSGVSHATSMVLHRK
jgi:hypothetical protein